MLRPKSFLWQQREASNSWKLYVTAPQFNTLHLYWAVWWKQVCWHVQSNSWADTVHAPPARVTCRTATLKDTPRPCPSLQGVQIPVQSRFHGMWQNPGQNRGPAQDPRHRLPVSWCQVAQTPSDVLTDQSCFGGDQMEQPAGGGFSDWCPFQTRNWSLFFFFNI